MDEEKQDIKNQYDLLYDNISKKLEQQMESLSSLDTKASILLAVVGVIFAGYFQLLTARGTGFTNYPLLMLLEIVAFVSSGAFTFLAFFLKRTEVWRDDPRPKKLLDLFAENSDQGEYWLKDKINKSMSESYEHNDVLITRKYEHLNTAKQLLYGGVALLVLHLLVTFIWC